MSVNDSQAKLKRAAKDLLVCWQRTSANWRDDNRRELEKKLLTPLQSEIRKAELAMERMDAMINQIQHSCR
jgi:hypothetical protein